LSPAGNVDHVVLDHLPTRLVNRGGVVERFPEFARGFVNSDCSTYGYSFPSVFQRGSRRPEVVVRSGLGVSNGQNRLDHIYILGQSIEKYVRHTGNTTAGPHPVYES